MSGSPIDRIDPLLSELQASVPPDQYARVEELVRCIVALYGEGLARIPALLTEEGALGSAMWRRLAADERIAALLVLHGLHPEPLAPRVERGLEKVRPYLGSHGGDVHLVSVDEETGAVRLRLDGSCDGCPASAATLQLAVAGAIRAEAPEVTDISVDDGAAEGLIQISGGATPSEWLSLPEPFENGETGVRSRELAGDRILVCRLGADTVAYRDVCAGCGDPLGGAKLEGERLTCASCGARFDLRHAGRSEDGGEPLAPLPLLARDGELRVAVART
jgi:Fe-S cluster biogenesis protein NfuA/nitrite reductase/ring-hydroxylating ferredoxin subunit